MHFLNVFYVLEPTVDEQLYQICYTLDKISNISPTRPLIPPFLSAIFLKDHTHITQSQKHFLGLKYFKIIHKNCANTRPLCGAKGSLPLLSLYSTSGFKGYSFCRILYCNTLFLSQSNNMNRWWMAASGRADRCCGAPRLGVQDPLIVGCWTVLTETI